MSSTAHYWMGRSLLQLGQADTAVRAFTAAVDAVSWAVPYILIGAVVVAPAWLVLTAWKAIRRR